MLLAFEIFYNNILPLLIIMSAGFALGKKFNMDVGTLTKVNFYILIPLFLLFNLYQTQFNSDAVIIIVITIIIMIANYLLGIAVSRFRGYDSSMRGAFQNSLMFYNSGNMGIPIITMVFSTGVFAAQSGGQYLNMALSLQVIVLAVQNVATNTIGLSNADKTAGNLKRFLLSLTRQPIIYAILAVVVLRLLPVKIEDYPIWVSMEYVKNALVPFALITLGIQLSRTAPGASMNPDVWLAVLLRLIAGPVIAWGLAEIFDLSGVIAQAMIISSAVPTSVNAALIAAEKNNHADFTSQVVLISTLLSCVTLALVILFSGQGYPV